MNALLNEYRYWRDNKIQQAFESPIADAEALKEYVESETMDFHYQYSESITLRQYKQCQWELIKEDMDANVIINEPLPLWCSLAIQEDDWDALFQEHKPQTEEEPQD